MEIYLEFRIDEITTEGYANGLLDKHKNNSIRWKLRPSLALTQDELEGAKYNIYLDGIYEDLDNPDVPGDDDIMLKALIVKAEYQPDISVIHDTQIGGFIPRGTIENIPMHITINMLQRTAGIIKEYIDGMGPMEAGIRAKENGWSPTGLILIATAILEENTTHGELLYDYIPTSCKEV